ncbi:MAG: hypothetical protein NT059_00265 [Planctomycetota bacterium]|nr:hypothetical protein [Planctomycetota bacterium]
MSSDADGFRIWSIGRDGVDDRGDLTICIPAVLGWFAPRGDFTRWSSP